MRRRNSHFGLISKRAEPPRLKLTLAKYTWLILWRIKICSLTQLTKVWPTNLKTYFQVLNCTNFVIKLQIPCGSSQGPFKETFDVGQWSFRHITHTHTPHCHHTGPQGWKESIQKKERYPSSAGVRYLTPTRCCWDSGVHLRAFPRGSWTGNSQGPAESLRPPLSWVMTAMMVIQPASTTQLPPGPSTGSSS